MSATFLIVGGGQAGAQAIDSLRRDGFSGKLILIGEETQLPYQRPPLSKKYLSGEMLTDRLLFRHAAYYAEHGIEVKLDVRAQRLLPGERELHLSNGQTLHYDRLLLATGARPRLLTCSGADLGRVHALRNIADVDAIRANLKPKSRVVIVGGGYIGLETAATAIKLGCEVTILEMADRAMNRVVAPVVSDFFMREHREHGVKIVCNTQVAGLEGREGVERVLCTDGTQYEADLVVVGVGAVPNVELARDAGIACENGITVDEYCRSSDANVFAAGDCCNHPSLRFGRRVRLESVDNAFEQAKTAALNMLDKPTIHDKVPWFWSDQFDLKLLIVGLSHDHDRVVVRGDPATRSFSVCYLKGNELLAVDTINHSKDYMAGRKLIAERTRMNLDKLADPAIALKERCSADGAHLVTKVIRIVFVEPSGRRREVMAAIGTTLMEAARRHGVEGIVAQCGGACACATCHAYADSSGFQRLGPAKDLELSMLELAWEPRPTSRLTCQIRVSAELADMEFTVPARQANQP